MLFCAVATAQNTNHEIEYDTLEWSKFDTDLEPGEYDDFAVVNITKVEHTTYYNSQRAYIMPYGTVGISYYLEEYEDEFGLISYGWEREELFESYEIVPKDHALVIFSPIQGKKKLNFVPDPDSHTTNPGHTQYCGLYGYDETTMINDVSNPEDYYYYRFSKDTSGTRIGFFWVDKNGGPFESTGHRAYLRAERSKVDTMKKTNSNSPMYYRGFNTNLFPNIDLKPSDIVDRTAEGSKSGAMYDLMGRRLTEKPEKGIYIINNKKYIVR